MKLLSTLPSLESPPAEAPPSPRAAIQFARSLTLAPAPAPRPLESIVDFEERLNTLGSAGERLLALAHRFDEVAHDDLKRFRVLVEWGKARDGDPLPDTALSTPEALILAAYPRPQLAGLLLSAYRRLRSDFQRRVLAEAAIALESRYPKRRAHADASLASPDALLRMAYPQYSVLISSHFERLPSDEQRALLEGARSRVT